MPPGKTSDRKLQKTWKKRHAQEIENHNENCRAEAAELDQRQSEADEAMGSGILSGASIKRHLDEDKRQAEEWNFLAAIWAQDKQNLLEKHAQDKHALQQRLQESAAGAPPAGTVTPGGEVWV